MANYALATSYVGNALLSGFNWFNGTDPTNGFVAYQSQQDALTKNLYSVDGITQAVTLRVDTTNVYPADGSQGGRPSIRLESKLPVNKGLVIGDFAHMPGSVCGSWPAFWMYGPDWPNNGEIDIIEGANTALKNLISGHTTQGCTLPPSGFTGTQSSTDCTSPGNNGNIGCGYVPPESNEFTYGDPFNSIGGGVYAVEWTDAAIKVWNFPRTAIPSDILDKQPDPSSWGLPQALFGGSTCDVDRFFQDMSIVINMDFCGDYAGNVWGITDTCNIDTESQTCVDWVAAHPQAFENVYWEINYIDVYEATTTTTSSASMPTTSSTSFIYSNQSTTATATNGSTTVSPTTINPTTINPTSVPAPTPTDSLTRDPPVIGDFVLLGCFGSNSSFVTFTSAGTNDAMTPEVCVGLCSSRKYAGVFDATCYCADTLDPASSALPDIDQCNQPCPGDSSVFCGGLASISTSPANSTLNSTLSSRFARRAVASPNILLTVYGNPGAGPNPNPAPAPALGGGGSGVTVTATATIPVMTTITTTMAYTTVCSTNPASLVVVEYCTTFTVPYCGCATQTTPSIPVTTVVTSCNACGANGASTVTLTLPVTGATTAASVPTTAQPTGAWNGSATATAYVTAGASMVNFSKEMFGMMVASSCALYLAVLL